MEIKAGIDLHMHTNISDGTDSPQELLSCVREAGITMFSITDHDSAMSSRIMPGLLREGDPFFIAGVEFSCKDEEGKYHILGYGYDPDSKALQSVLDKGHGYRMQKARDRLDYLEKEHGFTFPEEEVKELLALPNPGKPHFGNLMVKYGYCESKDRAIRDYIDPMKSSNNYIRPEEAIRGILDAGGIPVLAHPSFGSGRQLITGEKMDRRLKRLISYGLQGAEAFYSRFTEELCREILSYADRYGLYVTAGSDYHGRNKKVRAGETGFDKDREMPEGMRRFIEKILSRRFI